MSELIAEARVLVTPDTTAFRPLLVKQLATATAGVTVPVPVTPTVASTANLGAITAQQNAANAAQVAGAAARERSAAASRAAAKAEAEHARQLSQLQRGAAGAALGMTGLRGATLAATGPFLAGAAAVAVFAKSLGAAAQFETSLNVFGVTADATAQDMERISEVAKTLGRDLTLPGVTAQSAADALSQLSRAGLNVEDSISGVRGTLQLATAAAIDNEQAVTLVANALNAFALEGEDATRIADLFAAASKQSQGSIVDVGLAFQQSAAAAAQAGVSVEDTIALLTQLGRAGLRGSDAGTSLRVALLRLINPSKQAREEIDRLGIQIRDLDGNVRPEVFEEFTRQLSQLTKAQADATLAMIFGQDAFRAAAILGRSGARGLDETREAVQEQGAAAEIAGARAQGLAGAFENLKNQGEALGLSIGQGLAEPTEVFLEIVAGGLKNINDFNNFVEGTGEAAETASAKIRQANDDFARLVIEAGEANAALQRRVDRGSGGGFVGDDLPEDVKNLNQQLVETQSEGLKTRDVIEGLRASFDAAAGSAEGLTNRLDESFDRFATPLPTPVTAPQGPKPIGPTAKLDAAAQIAASNNDLRELERIQEVQLSNAQKALANSRGNVKQREQLLLQEAAAQANLNTTRRSIADKAATDAKAAAADAERIRREADQDLLAAQGRAETGQQSQIAVAQQTARLNDDIRETRDLKQIYLAQRAQAQQQIKDLDTRRAAVAALTAKIISTENDIKDLVKQQQQARAKARQDALDAVAENLSLRTQIAEARGNDDQILVALNNEIINQRKRVTAAKKAKVGVLQEQLALEQLLAQRRELREKIEGETEGAGGKSLAQFLTENTDLFNSLASSGGIRGVDPLTGFDFSASIVSATKQMQDAVKVQQAREVPGNRIPDAIDRLIAALERNTQAKETGNSAVGDVVTGGTVGNGGLTYAAVLGKRAQAMGEFWQARQARQMEEARYDGGQAT